MPAPTLRRRLTAWTAALTAALTTVALVVATGPGAGADGTDSNTPYACGTFGDGGAIGWAGNDEAVIACLGGSFTVVNNDNTTYGYGVYDNSRTTWVNAEGYLPALVTTFHRDAATIAITNFADKITIGGHAFVAVYSRVRVSNPTAKAITVDPEATAGLIPLNAPGNRVPAHGSVNHDYVITSDRFGASYAYPSSTQLTAAGGWQRHYAHMKAFWNKQLSGIAQITALPDHSLIDAYRTGFIYTQIIRGGPDGTELKTGVNGYDKEFSHDVVGILANMLTQGYTTDGTTTAVDLLLRLREVVGAQAQYDDGIWKYSWPWAIYLQKTGDLATVKKNFATPGPQGQAAQPSIEYTAHEIAKARTGPGGIMHMTDDIDSNGYWVIDNYSALMGLAAYRYLAQQVGNNTEYRWANDQYAALLAAVNRTLRSTISKYHLTYLPCSMVEPNTDNRCSNPEDANWAAPFLFGRWAWDGYLFGASINGPGKTLIDSTYRYGFDRLKGKLPPNTFGGYPTRFFSTAYNAGYGEWGLAGQDYRDQGILSYQFMIKNGQSGPYSWWESQQFPNPGSPWVGTHPADGNGSSPHAWGMANANLTLLDSLVAERSNGTLIVGRGVPNAWTRPGKSIALANVPTEKGGHVGVRITGVGTRQVRLQLTGTTAGPILFQLPAFLGNIARTSAGSVDSAGGTVSLPRSTRQVTVTLRHAV